VVTWRSPSVVSRSMVRVELRYSTSTSPEPSAVKRVEEESGTKRTFVGSWKIAAASPRQRSTSSPCHTLRLSGRATPATPVWMPQCSTPRATPAGSIPNASSPSG
jgi:hypothetical protein